MKCGEMNGEESRKHETIYRPMEVFEKARVHGLEVEETQSQESKISDGDLVLASIGIVASLLSVAWVTLIYKM